MQRSIVLVKPDGLQRGLIGEIISRFERKGLKLIGLKMMTLNDEILDQWYEHHKTKPFFPALKSFMTQTPIIAMVWEGLEAVDTIRKLVSDLTQERILDSKRDQLSRLVLDCSNRVSDPYSAAEKLLGSD